MYPSDDPTRPYRLKAGQGLVGLETYSPIGDLVSCLVPLSDPTNNQSSQHYRVSSKIFGTFDWSDEKTVQGKLGPGTLGPSPIWRQIGPRTFWGPICHFLANRAPADWAPWRQIGPRQIGPLVCRFGPWAANWAPANRAPANWAPVLYSFVLDIFCQQLGKYMSVEFLYIGIGYILPTIGGYMSFGGCQCSLREQGWGICIF